MKKRLALFDLGTNTFNLLVCDVEHGAFIPVYDTKIPVRLGEGGLAEGKILPEAMQRGIIALRSAMQEVTQLGCDAIVAIGTAALRGAKNADEFINQVKEELGIEIEIIDGQREAELIYKGVRQSGILTEESDLIMDIGGGSVEFILANKHQAHALFSFDTGVAKLLRKFHPSDPIKAAEIDEISRYLKQEFSDLNEAVYTFKPQRLIGSSGSFDSVRDMIKANEDWKASLNGHTVPRDVFEKLYQHLITKSKDERFNIPGLVPMRVDYIVLAVLLMNLVLAEFNFKAFTQSDFSIKEGLMAENL